MHNTQATQGRKFSQPGKNLLAEPCPESPFMVYTVGGLVKLFLQLLITSVSTSLQHSRNSRGRNHVLRVMVP